jgi:hypothetical protein
VVGQDHDAVGRHPGADESESGECTAVGEEAAPRAQNQRVDQEHVFVDEVAPHQRLDQLSAAHDHSGVIDSPLTLLGYRHCSLGAFQAMEGDDVLRQCYNTRGKCDVLPLEPARNSSTIPALEYLSEGTRDALAKTESRGEALSDFTKSSVFFLHQVWCSQKPLSNHTSKVER